MQAIPLQGAPTGERWGQALAGLDALTAHGRELSFLATQPTPFPPPPSADPADALLACAVELCRERARRKEAEAALSAEREALTDARQRLRHANRQSGVARLAGGVAHDFNNLLGMIVGYSESVRRSLAADDPRVRKIDQVLNAASRAAELTRQLGTSSRSTSLDRKPIDINRLATEMGGRLNKVGGGEVEVQMNLAPDLGAVLADPAQVQQLLLDLALNARDAMPGGGRLTIETAHVAVERNSSADSEHGGVPEGDYLLLSVQDTGVGMDETTKSRIFEPFFTTKPVDAGAGLGLATVHEIVAQTGGHILVESAPSQGTRFRIYLPFAMSAASRLGVEAQTATA